MIKAKFIRILIIILALIPNLIYAQIEDEFRMGEEETAKIRKTEVEPKLELWYLKEFGAFKDSTVLDTMLDDAQIYHPVFKKALTATYVGNYGTPYLNNDFFGRESNMNFFFAKSREAYMLTPATIKYYNTRTPYTTLEFSQSENKNRKSETRFNVLHTQNVNPYLNLTFRYDQAKSMGQYLNQESKNNFVTLYSSYNKDNWNMYNGFVTNSVKNDENGGLVDESSIFSGKPTDALMVNLTDVNNNFNSTYFYNNTEYRVGKYEELTDSTEYFRPIIGFLYSVQYERHKQEFMEEEIDSTFWDNIYYKNYNKDSIRFNKLTNVFQIKQYENPEKKVTFGKRAFIGQEIVRGSSAGFNKEVSNRHIIKYSNVNVGGGIFRETGNFWNWNFDGKLYLLGRNAGQLEINGVISKPMTFWGDSLAALIISGSLENLVSDPFQEEFYSNHVRWENNFKMEQRMITDGRFVSKKRKLEIGAKYAILNNYIYNDTLGIPTQTGTELVVLSAFADKDFNYRNLHFRTRLLWQKVSNEKYIHIPEWSAFISAYYQMLVSKVMHMQFGVDTRYNTKYYADKYALSTGLFHLQYDKKYGNFPYIDVYANLRLKRTTVFFKMMNIGTEFIDREYITTPTYPMNRATFRFGVSWTFYD